MDKKIFISIMAVAIMVTCPFVLMTDETDATVDASSGMSISSHRTMNSEQMMNFIHEILGFEDDDNVVSTPFDSLNIYMADRQYIWTDPEVYFAMCSFETSSDIGSRFTSEITMSMIGHYDLTMNLINDTYVGIWVDEEELRKNDVKATLVSMYGEKDSNGEYITHNIGYDNLYFVSEPGEKIHVSTDIRWLYTGADVYDHKIINENDIIYHTSTGYWVYAEYMNTITFREKTFDYFTYAFAYYNDDHEIDTTNYEYSPHVSNWNRIYEFLTYDGVRHYCDCYSYDCTYYDDRQYVSLDELKDIPSVEDTPSAEDVAQMLGFNDLEDSKSVCTISNDLIDCQNIRASILKIIDNNGVDGRNFIYRSEGEEYLKNLEDGIFIVRTCNGSLLLNDVSLDRILDSRDAIDFQIKDTDISDSVRDKMSDSDGALIDSARIVGINVADYETGDLGKVEVIIPYEKEDGQSADNFKVFYVKDDGTLEEKIASYFEDEDGNGFIKFETNHFSKYAIAYNACDHDLTKTESKGATCTEAGNNGYFTCNNCGKVFKDEDATEETSVIAEIIAAIGHDLVLVESKTPTCTEAGNKAYYECNNCGKYYLDEEAMKEVAIEDVTLAKAAHTLTKTNAKDATCTEAGNNAYYACSACKGIFKDSEGKIPTTVEAETIKALDHKMVIDEAVDATCTKTGLTAGEHCARCDFISVEQKEVPALGHKMIETASKEATCTEAGNNAYYACSVCKNVYKDAEGKTETTVVAEVIVALGHDIAKIVAEENICTGTSNGEYYACSVCKKNFIDENATVEAILGEHIRITSIVSKAPTTEEEGCTAEIGCEKCGKVFVESKTIPKLEENNTVILDANDAIVDADLIEGIIGSGSGITTGEEDSTNVTITSDAVEKFIDSEKDLIIVSGEVSVSFDTEALKSLQNNNENITFSVDNAPADLTDEQREIVGDNFVFSVRINGSGVEGFGDGTVTITVDYDLEDGQDPAHIKAYYVAEDGTVTEMEIVGYENGKVTFVAPHFSTFMIAYEPSGSSSYGIYYLIGAVILFGAILCFMASRKN